MEVDDHQWQEHFLDADLIKGPLAPGKMGGRVAVRAPLADMCELLGEETFAQRPLSRVISVDRLPFLVGKPRPVGNAGVERVGEIDKSLGF